MRILVATDAWQPQVNGVVRTLNAVGEELKGMGHEVAFITPNAFRSVPMPTYPEIRLALDTWRVPAQIDALSPDAIHIATEGPLGMATRRYCLRRGLPFTTSFHTRFPEYVHARTRVPLAVSYAVVRRFHRPARAVMVATKTVREDLERRGFTNLVHWTRGVDTTLFRPGDKSFLKDPRPIALYVGRVAVEKNIGAFLDLDLEGTKVVVGDGPQIEELRRRYPDVRFVGAKFGGELARYYGAADVFVFPSRTDTFGNVMLEALACGLPVAAYPVPGPIDVINGHKAGVLDEDLAAAVRAAIKVPAADCRAFAQGMSWRSSAEQFFANLAPFSHTQQKLAA